MPENSASNIDIDEPRELFVTLETTATADELWGRWQWLCELSETVGAHVTEIGQRWKDTTDPVAKDHLWVKYEAQTRDYRVLTSWKDLFYAAFIFSTDGAHCAALDNSPPLS